MPVKGNINADISEINLDVKLRKSWIWVEMLHSMFVSLTACLKVEVLKLSLRQSRSDMIKCQTDNKTIL